MDEKVPRTEPRRIHGVHPRRPEKEWHFWQREQHKLRHKTFGKQQSTRVTDTKD